MVIIPYYCGKNHSDIMKQKQNSIKILKYLISHDNEMLNISNIAKGANIDYKNTYNIVKNFQKDKIVNLKRIGNYNIVQFSKKLNPLVYEAEFNRREQVFKNKEIKAIFSYLKNLYFPKIILLFGSHAKGFANHNNDIDLMVIVKKNKKVEIERTLNTLPFDIHLIFFTYEEFISMSISKEFTVVSEAIKNNIIIHGIEDYYNLLSSIKYHYNLSS